MNDDKHNPASREEEDEAFWEDEGGDRTITSPFEPPDLGASAMPSPVSDPPPAGPDPEATHLGESPSELLERMRLERLDQPGTRPIAFAPSPLASLPSEPPAADKPALPTRPHDSESTRAVSGDAFFPFPDLGAFPPPPMPDLGPAAPSFDDPDHVVVGDGAVGDEATIAVAAPSPGSANIAAALAATLGAGAAVPDVWSSRNPGASSPGPSSPGPVPLPRTSPAASTMGGAMPGVPSAAGTPLSLLSGPGVPGAPFGIRDPASASMQVAVPQPQASHAPHPSSAAMQAATYPSAPSAGHGSQPHVASVPGAGPNPNWPTSPGMMAGPVATGSGYVPAYGATPGTNQPFAAPMAAPLAASPARSQTLLLAVVGVVCLTIFVVGVVLFLRS